MSDWYEKYTLGELPRRAAARWGEREALFFQGGRWSYPELEDGVQRAARALLAAGIEAGDHVALWLTNSPQWVYLMFALARIGAVQIPVNTRLRSAEIGYVLTQSDCVALITSQQEHRGSVNLLAVAEEWQPALREQPPGKLSLPDAPKLRSVIAVGEASHPAALRWDDLLAQGESVSMETVEARAAAVDPDDPLYIMYTSGTTGFPKGVMHSHHILRNVEDRANRLAITPKDVILMYLPLFHVFGYGEGPISSLLSGARMVLTASFDPEECLDLMERERTTICYGFDTHFKDLIEAQERKPRDTSGMRLGFLASGMHSSTPIAERFNELFCPSITGYGMTEVLVGAGLSFPHSTLSQRCESSGFPGQGFEIRVVNPETGVDRLPGEPGEIWVRGYALMMGYYKKPEETAKTIDPEGWLHTGDMGYFREDGYYRFLGRYKDMLKVGGENVDPMEVEGYLLSHPDIHQVALVGYPDERLGEVPVAFVQSVPAAGLEPDAVIAHCTGRIASFKIPRHVLLVEEFPMTSSGKIQKAKLRELALEQIGRRSGE
jgi:fatty-acyl-CoA synthase